MNQKAITSYSDDFEPEEPSLEDQVYDIIIDRGPVSISQVARIIETPYPQVKPVFKDLLEKGDIQVFDIAKNRYNRNIRLYKRD